ncbi:MAG: class I lanthipeptide [Spirosomataceae bacterium]
MKKNISKLALRTNKIVSLSKSQAQGIMAGAKPQTGKTCGADKTCWCND